MRKFLVAITIAGALVAAPTAAFAGEITGNGKLTPIKAQQTEEAPVGPAQSFCAFSGYNDGYPDEEPLRTQSWGSDGPSQFPGSEVSAAAKSGFILAEGPGTACRGLPTLDELPE